MMSTQLGPALPGETPAAVTTTMMSYVAARLEPINGTDGGGGNATAAGPAPTAAGGAAFAVPAEALALGGGDPVDQLLLVLAFDAHAGATGATNTNGSAVNGSAVNGSAVCATDGSNGNGTNGRAVQVEPS